MLSFKCANATNRVKGFASRGETFEELKRGHSSMSMSMREGAGRSIDSQLSCLSLSYPCLLAKAFGVSSCRKKTTEFGAAREMFIEFVFLLCENELVPGSVTRPTGRIQ